MWMRGGIRNLAAEIFDQFAKLFASGFSADHEAIPERLKCEKNENETGK